MADRERLTIVSSIDKKTPELLERFLSLSNSKLAGFYLLASTVDNKTDIIDRAHSSFALPIDLSKNYPVYIFHTPLDQANSIIKKYFTDSTSPSLWVVEQSYRQLIEGMKEALVSNSPLADLVSRKMTIVNLSTYSHSDNVDPNTGIRTVTLPILLGAFPTHSTPNS